jgi:hypothetical protein
MDEGLEETERADLEARLKKAKDFVKELEAHRPTFRRIRSGEFVMSADMEAVLEERRRKREEAEKEKEYRATGERRFVPARTNVGVLRGVVAKLVLAKKAVRHCGSTL